MPPCNRWHRATLIPLFCALLLEAGCHVQLLSTYDQVSDETATALQTKVDTFLIKMENDAGTPAGEYTHNISFYQEMAGALQAWRARAEATPKNQLTVSQITDLQASVEDLRQLHELEGRKGLRPALVAPIQSAFDAHFKAIIALEDAKKRGG